MTTAEKAREQIAAEAVNSLQWDKIHAEAPRRMMSDMCGGFYDEHLSRTIADHLSANILAALTASPAQDDQGRAFERAAEIALTFRPIGENAKHFVDVLVCDIAAAIRQEARNA